jgi:hypothetical protein
MEKSLGTGTSGLCCPEQKAESRTEVRGGCRVRSQRQLWEWREELTFSGACWERAGVDEKVLAVVEQAHSCGVIQV